MDKKVNADIKSLEIILDRNKFYFFPVVIIIVCLVLFFQFIIPQFKTLLIAREEAKEASFKLETLKGNLNILTNLDEASLDSQLKALNIALPAAKDFSGILNSINFSAQKTGVNLGAFSFQIGDLSKSENEDKFPTINLSVPINADIAAVNSFVEAMSKSVPLSEASFIKIGEGTSTINLSFYYKPISAADIKENNRVNPVSEKGLSLIDKLDGFENTSFFVPEDIPVATASGN